MAQAQESTRTVNPKEAEAAIMTCFKSKRPLFLWGPPGIGKSEVVDTITTRLEGFMIDLRLGQMEPTDLRGIPYFNKELGLMDWAPPIDLPSEELAAKYPIIVLFLDEMNAAAPSVQAAAYQLILNRRIGKYFLPKNVVIVAAGNRESDRGVTYRMPSPLANRFVHLEMRHDFDCWQEWAIHHRINNDVIGYLSHNKQDLFDFKATSASRAFATPRSWVFVSDLIDDGVGYDVLTNLVAGTVGEGLAVKFMAHRKLVEDLPMPMDILEGKVTELKVKEISAMYSLTISMCYELKDAREKKVSDDKWHKMIDCFFAFMMKNFQKEIVVMGARTALTTYDLPINPKKMKSFDEFHKLYGKYIIAANQ